METSSTFEIVGAVNNVLEIEGVGTVELLNSATGEYKFTADPDGSGEASFTYTVDDGQGHVGSSEIKIEVKTPLTVLSAFDETPQTYSGDFSDGGMTVTKNGPGSPGVYTELSANAADDTYVEFIINNEGIFNDKARVVGIAKVGDPVFGESEPVPGFSEGSYGLRGQDGNLLHGAPFNDGISYGGNGFGTGDVVGIHLKAGTLTFYLNGIEVDPVNDPNNEKDVTNLEGDFVFGASGQYGWSATLIVDSDLQSFRPTGAGELSEAIGPHYGAFATFDETPQTYSGDFSDGGMTVTKNGPGSPGCLYRTFSECRR